MSHVTETEIYVGQRYFDIDFTEHDWTGVWPILERDSEGHLTVVAIGDGDDDLMIVSVSRPPDTFDKGTIHPGWDALMSRETLAAEKISDEDRLEIERNST